MGGIFKTKFHVLKICIFLRRETEGIVGRDRRRVEGKVEKIRTDGRKEKIQINTIVHIDGKTARPQGNPT